MFVVLRNEGIMAQKVKVALDVMGGDNAPGAIV